MFKKREVEKKINPNKARSIIDKKLKKGKSLTREDLELCRAIRKERTYDRS
jgi:sialic acid synthase SpsE